MNTVIIKLSDVYDVDGIGRKYYWCLECSDDMIMDSFNFCPNCGSVITWLNDDNPLYSEISSKERNTLEDLRDKIIQKGLVNHE